MKSFPLTASQWSTLKKSKMNLNFTKFTKPPWWDYPLDLPSCVNPPPFPAFAAAVPATSAAPPAAAQAAAAARAAASAQAAAGSNATVPAWWFKGGWVNCWSSWHSCSKFSDNFPSFPHFSKPRFPFPKPSFFFGNLIIQVLRLITVTFGVWTPELWSNTRKSNSITAYSWDLFRWDSQ